MLSHPAKVAGHRRSHRRTSLLHCSGCLEVRANLFSACWSARESISWYVRNHRKEIHRLQGLKVSNACAQWSRSLWLRCSL